jgi:hypothetical protein
MSWLHAFLDEGFLESAERANRVLMYMQFGTSLKHKRTKLAQMMLQH